MGTGTDGASGAGLLSAMGGGAGGGRGRGTAFGRCARGAGSGDGCDGAVGGAGGPGGISRIDNGGLVSGVSPTFGNWTDIGGSSHKAAMCISIDNAMVTHILGITMPSFLLRNASIRSLINRRCHAVIGVSRTISQKAKFGSFANREQYRAGPCLMHLIQFNSPRSAGSFQAYCTRMLASRITRAHFSMSVRRKALNSAGVLVTATRPLVASSLFTSGACMNFTTSLLMR